MDIDEVFKGINEQVQQLTVVMKNTEEKPASEFSRFQSIEEQLANQQNVSNQLLELQKRISDSRKELNKLHNSAG